MATQSPAEYLESLKDSDSWQPHPGDGLKFEVAHRLRTLDGDLRRLDHELDISRTRVTQVISDRERVTRLRAEYQALWDTLMNEKG